MYYSIIPYEFVLNRSINEIKPDIPEFKMIIAGGQKLQARRFENGKYVVERLISSNPKDYLNKKYGPGEEIY